MSGTRVPSIALRRLGFEPARASAPFVATLVDVTGPIICFGAAYPILRGTMRFNGGTLSAVRRGPAARRRHEALRGGLMVEPIKRLSGPVPAEQKRGELVWSIPLNDKPTAEWIKFFRNPGVRAGFINPERVAFREAELGFVSAETHVKSWVQHIDRWITAANDAMAQADEKRWEDRRRVNEQAEQQAQRLRDADKYRDL